MHAKGGIFNVKLRNSLILRLNLIQVVRVRELEWNRICEC